MIPGQYAPYERVQGYGTAPEIETVPYMVRDYLMDLPRKGYTPQDDNRLFRCQLMKYLYYDEADPLSLPLPTPEQKRSLVFDPFRPDVPPTDKGYRIFTQSLISQAQTEGQTIMRIFMGRVLPVGAYRFETSINFHFLSNAAYEGNTQTMELSRTFKLAMLTIRALNGVNLGAGVGTVYFDRTRNAECDIYPINDESVNVGYRMTLGLTCIGTDENDQ